MIGMSDACKWWTNAIDVKGRTMSNLQYKKRNLVCETKTAVFNFNTMLKSLMMCTHEFVAEPATKHGQSSN